MARVKGICRICDEYTMLDPHHIISQRHAKKTRQYDLISNQGNVVHICRNCHDQTTASKSYRKLNKEYKSEPKTRTVTCGKCGRTGHNRTKCYAKTTVDGVKISTPKWVYRKKAKPKKAKPNYTKPTFRAKRAKKR